MSVRAIALAALAAPALTSAPALAAPALASAPTPVLPSAPALPAAGWRIAAFDAPTGLRVGQEIVAGGTGGTLATTASARWTGGSTSVVVAAPFASFRTPSGRDTEFGNLQIDAYWTRQGRKAARAFGLETHVGVGGDAYTWTNQASELWPGTGADLVWLSRRPAGRGTVLTRASAGLHAQRGYEPMPPLRLALQAQLAYDRPISSRFGVVGEASIAYWDLSPLEASALGRFDLSPKIRARAGLVLPLSVWAGWTPSGQPAGVTETTFVFDLAAHL